MGKYDPSKDKVLDFREVNDENGSTNFEVKLVSYEGGDIKVQINPFFINQGEKSYAKLSRIKLSLWDKIDEAVKEMEANI